MATAVPPRISDGSDTSIPGAATGTLAGGGALDVEGDAVRDAIDKLQKALTPSVVLDRELDARRNDAAKVASGAAYKSPYHDAHHATIVAASALLGRALGEGGVGTGFVYGAETMVRDALLMIEGAARDALRRDEGELPRLFDIAEGMRKRRDDARAAARQLVLAFSRQNAGMGFRERRRLRDAVAQARAESTRETEQEKARLAKEHESMREELELMQRQLIAARDASNAQIVQLSKQVQHERDARGGDALEHQQTGEHVRAKLEMAEVKIADLANQLRNAQREHAIEKARLEDRLSEALEVGEGARAHAVNARTVLRRQKGRALRERCFVVWKIKAAACVALNKQTMEAAETVKAVKKGYEVQIAKTEKACVEKVESMRNKLRGRDPRDANKPALGDSTNQKKGGNKAPRADPWSFLDESTKLEREIAKREREEERRARETVAMAMAEEHISKIDEYYAKAAEAARQRNAGRDDPNPEIVMVAHNVSLASHPPPSPLSMPLTAREPRQSKGFVHTYGGDRGATPRSGASSARSMIEPTPPRTAGRVPAPTRVPVRRAESESESSSSSEAAEDPWKPESPEPPPPPPPKLGEPAEELAFTESLYGLVPPPQVPLGRKTRDAGVAAPRTEEEVEPARSRRRESWNRSRRRRARGSAEREEEEEDSRRRWRGVGTSRAPPRASSPRGTERRRRRFDPIRSNRSSRRRRRSSRRRRRERFRLSRGRRPGRRRERFHLSRGRRERAKGAGRARRADARRARGSRRDRQPRGVAGRGRRARDRGRRARVDRGRRARVDRGRRARVDRGRRARVDRGRRARVDRGRRVRRG